MYVVLHFGIGLFRKYFCDEMEMAIYSAILVKVITVHKLQPFLKMAKQ